MLCKLLNLEFKTAVVVKLVPLFNTFSSKALHIIMALAADNSLLCLLYFNFKMKSRIYIIFDNFFFSLYFPINDNNDDNNYSLAISI